MSNNNHGMSNQAALKRVGIRLLPGEELDAAVELESSLTEVLEPAHATLLLTNRRLIRYTTGGHRVDMLTRISQIRLNWDWHSRKKAQYSACNKGIVGVRAL